MNKLVFIPLLLVAILGMAFWSMQNTLPQVLITSTPLPTETPQPTDFTASFEIYTNGTKRIFTASMYHNQSPDVFIQNPDPSIIYIKRSGITWNDFFKTLPFSLTKDCLTTGTKQTFCSNDIHKLKFILNGSENPQLLDLNIDPGDNLQVRYEPR